MPPAYGVSWHIKNDKKIKYFLYPSNDIKEKITGNEGNSHADVKNFEVHAVYNDEVKCIGPHEDTHILTTPLGLPPQLFREGLAEYMAGSWDKISHDQWAKKFLDEDKLPDISKIIDDEIWYDQDDMILYPSAGSFVAFIIKNQKKEKFLQLYKLLSRSNDVKENILKFNEITGKSLDEIQIDWQVYLSRLNDSDHRNNIPIKITKHAQSCFFLEKENTKILVDPGSFVFNEEGLKPEDFKGTNIILITHSHFDHFDPINVSGIISQNNPIILSTKEVVEKIKESNPMANVQVLNDMQLFDFNDNNWTIYGYQSIHGPLPDGRKAPETIGFVVSDKESQIYFPGDTILLNNQIPSVCLIAVPICGQVVMNPQEAVTELIRFKKEVDSHTHYVIPIHYDNPNYPVDVKEFEKLANQNNIKTKVLKWGQSTIL